MVYKFLLLLLPMSATAQNAQIKLYLQQIVANQAVIKSIEKGIDIARTGLNLISASKRGEFDLHRIFFTALGIPSPVLRQDFRVNAIRRMSMLVSSKSIPFNKKLLEETASNLEELQRLLTPGQYQLNDAERGRRIETLYEDMLDKFIFYKQFE